MLAFSVALENTVNDEASITNASIIETIFLGLLLFGCAHQNNLDTSESVEEIEIEEQEPIEGTEEIVKKESFYHQFLSEDLIVQLESLSPINSNEITYDELRPVYVLHYDFEGNIQEGELINCSSFSSW